MTLIIETGDVVPGANSYASVEDLEAYALLRGATLPEGVEEKERLLIKAMDYIQTFASRFSGSRYLHDQPLDWPRLGAIVDGYYHSHLTVPDVLIEAQCELAIAAQTTDLLPPRVPGTKGAITQVTAGPVSVSYADPGADAATLPRFPKADALLRRLFRTGAFVATRRV